MRMRWIKLIGAMLTMATLAFIGMRLWQDRAILASWQPDGGDLLRVVAAILIYACGGVILALAWIRLLHNLVPAQADTRMLIGIYARSQLAKYVPGNVAHFAGRHVLGRRKGYAHSALAVSALLEIVLLLMMSAAIVIISGLAPHVPPAQHGSLPAQWMPLLLIAIPVGMYAVFRWFWPYLRHRYPQLPHLGLNLARLFEAFVAHAIFFMLGGWALKWVIETFDQGVTDLNLLDITAIFAFTWLIGSITPGAPSGMGVREAALVVLLQPSIGSAWAVLAAVVLRLVTMVADVLFFCVGLVIDRRKDNSGAPVE